VTPVLEVDGLVKHFPIAGSRARVRAVNTVSFAIAKGETFALVGESGSGKTTVGRCVIGLIEPTAGRISFQGKPIDRRRNIRSRELRGRMQLVFQEPAESLDRASASARRSSSRCGPCTCRRPTATPSWPRRPDASAWLRRRWRSTRLSSAPASSSGPASPGR
jgi:ABC-type oligopeptide transport system ATPase subunit